LTTRQATASGGWTGTLSSSAELSCVSMHAAVHVC
jgi:hypothetical protein